MKRKKRRNTRGSLSNLPETSEEPVISLLPVERSCTSSLEKLERWNRKKIECLAYITEAKSPGRDDPRASVVHGDQFQRTGFTRRAGYRVERDGARHLRARGARRKAGEREREREVKEREREREEKKGKKGKKRR